MSKPIEAITELKNINDRLKKIDINIKGSNVDTALTACDISDNIRLAEYYIERAVNKLIVLCFFEDKK